MTDRRTRSDVRRRAAALLDQQVWCWGRDVARKEGNVLLELGMCRARPPVPGGSTQYTGRTADGGAVWLWGFGFAYHQPDLGGVFLRRYRFDPVLLPAQPVLPVHDPDDIGRTARPVTARERAACEALVRAAAAWAGGYEHWVAEHFGTAYRAATLAARDKPPAVPAQVMAKTWDHLAKKAARLAGSPLPNGGPWADVLARLRAGTVCPRETRLGKRVGHPPRLRGGSGLQRQLER